MQEEKVQDAVVSEVEEVKADDAKKDTVKDFSKRKKREYYAELVLFLALGVLVGIAMKTEAIKKITIGFDDYKMKIDRQDYNINQFQKDLSKAAADQASQQGANAGQDQNAGGSDANQGDANPQGGGAPDQGSNAAPANPTGGQ